MVEPCEDEESPSVLGCLPGFPLPSTPESPSVLGCLPGFSLPSTPETPSFLEFFFKLLYDSFSVVLITYLVLICGIFNYLVLVVD